MTEYIFNSLVATALKNKVKHAPFDIKIIYQAGSFSRLVKRINAENPAFIVALHCNAFDTKATGKEALYSGSSHGYLLALSMYSELTHETPSRCVKIRSKHGRGGYLLHRTKSPCTIVEPFFIDSHEALTIDICKLVDDYYTGIQDAFLMLG